MAPTKRKITIKKVIIYYKEKMSLVFAKMEFLIAQF